LRELADQNGYKYHDIINELKIIEDDTSIIIKVALYRNAILLSAESESKDKAQKKILSMEKMISEL
jgi:hypothetical protein